MERKQEEQARQMKELQGHAERLQQENDQLRAQIEKSHDLGKDVRDSSQVGHPTPRNKRKEPIVPNDVETPVDDELSLGSSPSLSLSSAKNARGSTKTKLRKRPSHHPAFSDAVSGTSRMARRKARRRQNQLVQAPRNVSVLPEGTTPPVLLASTMPLMPVVHLAFGTRPTFYMPHETLIYRPKDML